MFAVDQRPPIALLTIVLASLILRVFFLGHHDLLVEEAYYWNYAIHLDFGYLDHPPLIALLIRLSTTLLGVNEFAVRFPALLCWGATVYFMYRWCELIHPRSGQFSILLLSILPFFFLYSCVITPDLPLMATWSATLYFLYRALCLQQARLWYAAGVSVGLGMLAKYTIILLLATTGLFILFNREYWLWLRRKEPYLAVVIALVLFSPVIYWNATHHWASFVFQSTRRLQGEFTFSLHELLGVLILFITPIGIIGLGKLYKPSLNSILSRPTHKFLQIYTLVTLLVFAAFSLFRAIKLNWIGPSILALVPWLSLLISQQPTVYRQWLKFSPILILTYTLILFCVSFGKPLFLNQQVFSKMISWEHLTQDFYHVAATQCQPVFLPLDTYSIASELVFYQNKQWQAHPNLTPIPVHHAAMFDFEGLMFEIWHNPSLQGKTIILIGKEKQSFDNELVLNATQALSPIKMIWGESQGFAAHVRPYYYRIVKMIDS